MYSRLFKIRVSSNTILKQAAGSQRGFTLIELLIVVAILGTLAGVAIPNVGSFMKRSAANAANTELANVQTASVAYLGDHLQWPANTTDLLGYLQGTPKATYGFDTVTGYVVSVSDVIWSGITWYAPPGSPPSQHGHWDR